MSILSGYGKFKRYVLTDSGYKLCSQWTSSNTVHFDDGNTAQTKVGAINGITDSLTATNSNIALSAAAGKSLQDQVTQINTGAAHAGVAVRLGSTDNRYDQLYVRTHTGTPSHPIGGGMFMMADMDYHQITLGIDGLGGCPVKFAYGDKNGNDITSTYVPRSWTKYAENIIPPTGINLTDLCTPYISNREIHITAKVITDSIDFTFTKTIFLSELNIAANAEAGRSIILYAAGGYHSTQYYSLCEFKIQNYMLYINGCMINGENKKNAARMWVTYR